MTEPATTTFKLNAEIEIPEGYELTITLKPVRPAEPDEALPPTPAPALRAAA